jgi:isoleucyl-tRNA synthetase
VLIGDVTEAYETFEFHRVYHQINAFCAVELSSFYVDVMKDLLYTLAPDSQQRRSAQTVLYETVGILARLVAPIMPFTADEAWGYLPQQKKQSIHLARFPEADAALRDTELEARWEQLLRVRQVTARELEKARQSGVLGKSLEALVEIAPDTEATATLLGSFGPLLAQVFIVSSVVTAPPTGGDLRVTVQRANGTKCVRCWRWTQDVGTEPSHPELCGRCAEAVKQ